MPLSLALSYTTNYLKAHRTEEKFDDDEILTMEEYEKMIPEEAD